MLEFMRGKTRKGGLRKVLLQLHRDERGADMLEKLLIVAALVLPLLAILILFGTQLKDWLAEQWAKIMGESDDLDETPF